MSPEILIDGFGPLQVEEAGSTSDIAECVRAAVRDKTAIYPVGGGTTLHLGSPPSKPGRAVKLTALNQVIDYPARDMTITVQAGITVARLREILSVEKQRLPIDVAHADRATLGGILSTNQSGPRRFGYGTLRDYLLGISVINDEGQEVKAGGRVVKNVAGYDLPKLYIGALGTLGIITQVTLKLRPQPEQQAVALVSCPLNAVGDLLDQLYASRTRPVCIDLLNQPAVEAMALPVHDGHYLMAIGYEGQSETVFWQVNQLVQELKAGWPLDVRLGSTAAPVWEALTAFGGDAMVSFKANMLPAAAAEFLSASGSSPLVHAHAGNGIIRGHFSQGISLEETRQALDRWRTLAANGAGQVIIERCPSVWKKELSVWDTPRGDFAVMKAVKNNLDPHGVFNPGRFVGGI